MHRTWFLGLLMGALFAACSDDGGDSGGTGAAAGAGGAGASAGASNGGSGACDPKPGSDAGKSDAANSTGGTVFVSDGGNIDLDSGSPFPDARYKCWDADSGAGFMCENFGMTCCDKKDVCYDPATEPSFCDYPYCD